MLLTQCDGRILLITLSARLRLQHLTVTVIDGDNIFYDNFTGINSKNHVLISLKRLIAIFQRLKHHLRILQSLLLWMFYSISLMKTGYYFTVEVYLEHHRDVDVVVM